MSLRRIEHSQETSKTLEHYSIEDQVRIEAKRIDLTMRRLITYILPLIFTISVVSTIVTIFLVGFKVMALSDTVIVALIGETIADIAAILYLIITRIYSK